MLIIIIWWKKYKFNLTDNIYLKILKKYWNNYTNIIQLLCDNSREDINIIIWMKKEFGNENDITNIKNILNNECNLIL